MKREPSQTIWETTQNHFVTSENHLGTVPNHLGGIPNEMGTIPNRLGNDAERRKDTLKCPNCPMKWRKTAENRPNPVGKPRNRVAGRSDHAAGRPHRIAARWNRAPESHRAVIGRTACGCHPRRARMEPGRDRGGRKWGRTASAVGLSPKQTGGKRFGGQTIHFPANARPRRKADNYFKLLFWGARWGEAPDEPVLMRRRLARTLAPPSERKPQRRRRDLFVETPSENKNWAPSRYPNGIKSFSPGLRGTSYPGFCRRND